MSESASEWVAVLVFWMGVSETDKSHIQTLVFVFHLLVFHIF